jgi:hypothetical protein
MTNYCNGKKSDGSECKRPAGWGTDHAGTGRCKLHGGASVKGIESPTYKHGRYSKYAPPTLQEQIQDLDNYDVLELVDELQTQRALIASYIERYQKGGNMSEMSISTVISWFNSVGIMVERIMKMKNETALTSAELALLKMRTADLVIKYIDDPEKQRAFVVELFQISQPAQLE